MSVNHTNTVTVIDPAEPRPPTIGMLAAGTMFMFEEGLAIYMRTDRSVGSAHDCVHLGSGKVYTVDNFKHVKVIHTVNISSRGGYS